MRAARHLFAASLLALGFGSGLAAATTPAASLDTSFGAGGFAVLPSIVSSAGVQPDGKLLVLSSTSGPQRVDRYGLTGALDTSFGVGGTVNVSVNGSTVSRASGSSSLLVAPDGRFYVPARVDDPCKVNAACDEYVLLRYLPDGQIDTSFGGAGYVPLAVSKLRTSSATATPALDPNGDIVVGETATFTFNLINIYRSEGHIERFSPTGASLAYRKFDAGCGAFGIVNVTTQGDGATLVTGSGFATSPCLTRVDRNLSTDPAFGQGETVIVNPVTGVGSLGSTGTFISPAGNIVAGTGWSYPTPNDIFGTLTGLTAKGQVDTAYGVPNGSGNAPAKAFSLAQSCAGKLVGAAASDVNGGNPAILLTRYNSNGSLDVTFSGTNDGVIATPVIRLYIAGPVLVRPDGTILVIGIREQGTPPNISYGSFVAAYKQADCRRPTDAGLQTVVEYYNAAMDHYFMTAASADMTALDSGRFVGWQRTGYTFASASSLTNPVCRFYIPPAYGDSHFFSASPVECGEVQSKFPQFVYETNDAMRANVPDVITGACFAPASVPVYRVWDKRTDTNHRYMTSREVRDAMVAKGWVPEGYGPDAVAMCVVPQ